MRKALVVGGGLSGAVIARELANNHYEVEIVEKRCHVGGNMYDHKDEYGIYVHDYGPHTFHTKKRELYDYICKYGEWDEFHLKCGAVINGICTPTPFNFKTIDDFYTKEEAEQLKSEIKKTFPNTYAISVVEALECGNEKIEEYARFLFDNDYSLYTAKQWGVSPKEIDAGVLKRVPLKFDYSDGYFDDDYQVMPRISYSEFFNNILNHPNIHIRLNTNIFDLISINDNQISYEGRKIDYPFIYSGPLDELFDCCYGKLPYRSLRFEWIHEKIDSKQEMPVVAYPQETDIIRIIEYKKLPTQNVSGTTYEVEYSMPYSRGKNIEPYYPILTKASELMYSKYLELSNKISNLYVCGRLGDFKYYNMDQALEKALSIATSIIE